MGNMQLKDIVRIQTASINPMDAPDKLFHLYSLPSFDDNQKREEVYGHQIQSNKSIVPDKCILFNKLNVRFQRIWLIDNDDEDKICSTEFLPLIVNESKVDFYYCYFLLHSPGITNYLTGQNTNTSGSHKRIDPDDFLSIEVQLPALPEQKRIGKFLYDIEQKITVNRQVNDYLEAMARQLYDYWFVQFDFPDVNAKPYKSSGGKMVWDEKLKRAIPYGWKDGQLIDIANITMGQSPDGSSYNETGDGILFYQGSTDFGIRFPSVRQYTNSPTRLAKKGDILMSVRAPVGAVNIANNDCCIGRGLAALNSKIGSITHLYFIIRDLKTAFDNKNAVGTTFGSITKDELFSLPVVVPDASVIERFESMCSPIFGRQMVIGKEVDDLIAQRDELLPLLMNGQVSVRQLNNHL